MNSSKYLSLSTFSILALSIIFQTGLAQDNQGFNWRSPGFDENNSNFNPQSALNKNNIEELNQEWMTSLSKIPNIYGNETVRTTSNILMVNGFIYLIDRAQILLALDSEDSSLFWSSVLALPDDESYDIGEVNINSHLLNYFEGKVWLIDIDCSIKGFSGYNGAIEVEIPPQVLCGVIPNNSEPRETTYRAISAPILYKEDNLIIATPSGFETKDYPLNFIVGISLDNEELVWKTSLAESQNENLNLAIGPGVIDQEAGRIFIGTGSPIPEWNATLRSGPNLYSNSIIALDASNGEIIWSYQTIQHDLNGYGCTGNIILSEIDGRKAVFSACRNGYLYALDAENGDLIWFFNPPSVKRVNSENANFVETGISDIEKPWANYPSIDPVIQCPGIFGAAPFNIAIAHNTIYMTTFNSCSRIEVGPVERIGDTGIKNLTDIIAPVGPVNSTLYAIDISTGNAKWSRFFDGVAIKGGITISGDLIYLPMPNGNLYTIDSETGSQIWERYFGALGLAIPPVIAASARLNWTLIQVVAGTPLLEESLDQRSGFLFVFNLPSSAVSSTTQEPNIDFDYTNITYIVIGVAIILLVSVMFIYNRRRK